MLPLIIMECGYGVPQKLCKLLAQLMGLCICNFNSV